MRNFIIYFLLLIVVGEIIVLFILNKNPEEKILPEMVAITPNSTVVETFFPTLSPTFSPDPILEIKTPKQTFFPKPSQNPVVPNFSSQEINEFIERFAVQYGVDPNIIRYIAICESGFNPSAYRAGYAGLFQFGQITWNNLRKEIGEDENSDLRYNAEEAIQTAAYAISVGKIGLWPNCRP